MADLPAMFSHFICCSFQNDRGHTRILGFEHQSEVFFTIKFLELMPRSKLFGSPVDKQFIRPSCYLLIAFFFGFTCVTRLTSDLLTFLEFRRNSLSLREYVQSQKAKSKGYSWFAIKACSLRLDIQRLSDHIANWYIKDCCSPI